MSINELRTLAHHPLPEGSAKWRYRQLFLFSFAFIGVSFIDMAFLQENSLVNGRLNFRRRKTGRLYSIGLNEYNTPILHSLIHMNSDTSRYLLPILNANVTSEEYAINYARDVYRRCNKHLKLIAREAGLDESISTYYARYSWANVARKLGYSKDMIAEGLGHSYGNRVTSIYLDDYDATVIDEMNLSVLRCILG